MRADSSDVGCFVVRKRTDSSNFSSFCVSTPLVDEIGGNEICFCLTADHTKDTIMDGQNFCHGVSLYSSVRPIIVLCLREDGHAPCLPRGLAAKSPQCEATGKQHATCWRLTSPGTVRYTERCWTQSGGRCGAHGGSTLIEGCLGHGERLQTLPLTSSLGAEHISSERAKLSPPDHQKRRSKSQAVGSAPVLCTEQSSCREKYS
jgi:hypothetical protein